MPSLFLTLFLAGMLTIFLPCILPLVPIVLGVSIAGQNRWRPLVTVVGMIIGFVFVTAILQVLLAQFVALAVLVQTATFDALLLFGAGFLSERRSVRTPIALFGGIFFLSYGWPAAIAAAGLNIIVMEVGGVVAGRLQQLGADVQGVVRQSQGADSLVTAFIVGLTLGLVWVPCAGPALGFALALVHDQPGLRAFLALTAYAVGAGVPLLIVGYGGQYAVSSVRSLNRYTGVVKHIAGTLLIFTAIALQWNLLANFQVWLAGTRLATVANTIEDSLFPNQKPGGAASVFEAGGVLPDLGPAPEFKSLGPWHNSEPLPVSALKGKVILVDFWTYSCINCIRTLPYIQSYWDRFKEGPFLIVGVHTPEFSFEQDPDNVAAAIKNHGLTYPVAQDNSYGTWRAFSNHYWPAKYLIDATGRIRYEHFGEGGYEETALAIQSLLEEAGYSFAVPKMEPVAETGGRALTPETYLGVHGWSSLVNAPSIPTDEATEYVLPASVPLNGIALGGQWQMRDDERQVLLSESGSIRIHALAGEVNLVLGVEDEDVADIPAQVTVDGQPGPTLTIGLHDLYTLFKGAYGEHDIVLTFAKSGVAAYAFTFGE